jgi:hypothetical protein
MAGPNPETTIPSEKSRKSSVKLYKVLGQICEVASVVLLSWGALWLYFNLYSEKEPKPPGSGQSSLPWLLPSLTLLAAGLAFFAAIKFSEALAEESERLASGIKYKVNKRRIDTLREAKVPEDVLRYLSEIKHDYLMTEKEFLSQLESELGQERASEVKAAILKYTRVYVPDEANATLNPASTTATPGEAQG